MTLRVHNIDKWRRFVGGNVLALPGLEGEMRTVRVDFNTVGVTKVYLVDPDDTGATDPVVFLGAISGRDSVEFSTSGQTFLTVLSDEDVWFHTSDVGEKPVDLGDAYSFAKLLERRERNPQLELMMFIARRNEEKRDAKQAQELAAMRSEFAAQIAAAKANPLTGEIHDESPEPPAGGSSGATRTVEGGEQQSEAVSVQSAAKKAAGTAPSAGK